DTDKGRRLSLMTLGLIGVGVASGVAGVVITRLTSSVSGDRQAVSLPRAKKAAAAIPESVQPKGVELPPFVTDNADFYRIDTALSV
ncbi:oxidoreductase, partial [Mycobacterium sp. ITM-2017-0098]